MPQSKSCWLNLWLNFALIFGLLILSRPLAAQTKPTIIISLPPLAFLALSLSQGTELNISMLSGANQSPHGRHYSPQEVQSLTKADLVVWLGPELESGMASLINKLGLKDRQLALLSANQHLTLYPYQAALIKPEPHDDDHDHDHDQPGLTDPHIWLDTTNAALMAETMAQVFANLSPADKTTIATNLQKLRAELSALDKELAQSLAPLTKFEFVVWHDGLQYFAKRYHLRLAAVVTDDPEMGISAKRLQIIGAFIRKNDSSTCLISEAEFPTDLSQKLAKDWQIATTKLDGLGIGLPFSPHSYKMMMQNLAQSLLACQTKVIP